MITHDQEQALNDEKRKAGVRYAHAREIILSRKLCRKKRRALLMAVGNALQGELEKSTGKKRFWSFPDESKAEAKL